LEDAVVVSQLETQTVDIRKPKRSPIAILADEIVGPIRFSQITLAGATDRPTLATITPFPGW